jgi:chemotaxis protein CheX
MSIPGPMLTALKSSTEEVFETMVFKPLVETSGAAGNGSGGTHVVAAVAFAGHRCGMVTFTSSLTAAKAITGAMLGMDESELVGEVPDAIGEVANMIAGTFRNKLAAIEPASAISVPAVTIGSDFHTQYGSHVRRAVCPFEMDGLPVAVELILTGE